MVPVWLHLEFGCTDFTAFWGSMGRSLQVQKHVVSFRGGRRHLLRCEASIIALVAMVLLSKVAQQ